MHRVLRTSIVLGSVLASILNTAARAQIGKLGSAVAEAEAERSRLANALDEANGRHQSGSYSLNVRLGSLQSRALSAEKLLAEARQAVIARTEEGRGLDRKNVEITIALSAAEKKVRQLEASVEAQERQIRDHEQTRSSMGERSNGLTRSLRERETVTGKSVGLVLTGGNIDRALYQRILAEED